MWESRNVEFEEIGKATVSEHTKNVRWRMFPAASSSAVFTTSSRFYDVLLESKGAFHSALLWRKKKTRRGNKANRTKKTRSYLGEKRKKNNRSPISRLVRSGNVPEHTSGHKEFLRQEPSVKEKITTPTRDEITLQIDSEKLEMSAPVTVKTSRYCC